MLDSVAGLFLYSVLHDIVMQSWAATDENHNLRARPNTLSVTMSL